MTNSENTKLIPLTQGQFAIVDACDYEWLSQWKWHFSQGYAARHVYQPKSGVKRHNVMMHRAINQTPDGLDTDHINGDKLNNRRCNLRSCTKQQNQFNASPRTKGKSKYKGVYLLTCHKKYQYWIARININGKRKHLGCFKMELDAALAYNEAAIKYYGEFARLNECG